MENVGMFFCHLEYFTANWYIIWPIGNLHSGNLVCISPFWYIVSKNLATLNNCATTIRENNLTKIPSRQKQKKVFRMSRNWFLENEFEVVRSREKGEQIG
jgi:hypothetical protein